MNPESCIAHRPKQALAIIRQDYYELMNRDACGAALLNIFEYWANAALAVDVMVESPWVGARPIREFEQMLLGIATDKQIRKRLVLLEARGFIQAKAPTKRGAAKEYRVMISEIQRSLVDQMTELGAVLRSNSRQPFGQMTDDERFLRSNDPRVLGQITDTPSVKQPMILRSNDRALKKKTQEFRKESLKEADLNLSDLNQDALAQSYLKQVGGQFSREEASPSPVQIGVVRYARPPETIDFTELWATNPGMAKAQLRFIAIGHKRLDMVAHGFGQWWVGPGLNDFDESLIQACQKRKRNLQQPDSVGDAKTFINNMLRNGDWGNFSLRCEEAEALARQKQTQPAMKIATQPPNHRSPFERSEQDRQASALGLIRFKMGKGEIEQAQAIARQVGLSFSEVGIALPIEQRSSLSSRAA